jgi:hypothetical protein
MIRSKFTVIYMLFISVLLSSCASQNGIGSKTIHSTRVGTFMPNDIRLNMTMDDFQYLGTQEVSVSYKQYLGVFTVFNEINSQEVARRTINIVDLSGNANLPIKYDSKLLRALYVALVNIPDADFVVPTGIITERDQMFLGSTITKKMKVKMYKIKEK